MDIFVCIKRVPDTAEVPIDISGDEKDIKKDGLVYDINETDNYALEEALLIKEKTAGTVTVVTVGDEDCSDILRKSLAKGADSAIRVWGENINIADPNLISSIIAKVLENKKCDLILTGCIANDDGYAQVGTSVAEMLGLPHASIVTEIDLRENEAEIKRELEDGLLEVVQIKLPALFTIQTGINEPRYASMIGIRKAAQKKIEEIDAESMGFDEDWVKKNDMSLYVEELYIPQEEKTAEIFEGTPEETSGKIAEVLRERGGLQ